jgi:hypothetical protein
MSRSDNSQIRISYSFGKEGLVNKSLLLRDFLKLVR